MLNQYQFQNPQTDSKGNTVRQGTSKDFYKFAEENKLNSNRMQFGTHDSQEQSDQELLIDQRGSEDESGPDSSRSANQDYSESRKFKILCAGLLALFIANMMLLNMSVLLPKYINDRNENNQWTVAEGQSLE